MNVEYFNPAYLVTFHGNKLTLDIGNMNKMILSVISSNEAMTSGSAEIAHTSCLDITLDSVGD